MLQDFDSKKCEKFNPNLDFKACESFDPATDPRECGFCKQEQYYRCIAHKGQIPLSHSTIQNFLTCHHLCYLVNVRGIQVRDVMKSSPLKCGVLWDAVLGKHYGALDKETKQPYDIPALIKRYEIEPRDVAKVRGLYRAYKMLEVQIDDGFEIQKKIDLTIGFDKVWGDGVPVEVMVTGFYDRFYADNCFVENKFSGRPDLYQDPFFIQSQIGTYFLADPSLESCIMEICRNPDLKSTHSHKDEDAETYGERVYQDALSRPGHYFIGWNIDTHRYGRRYYRKEFNLEEIRNRYIHIFREFWEANKFGGFYKNDRACAQILPGIPCEYISLCRHNNMSETIYKIRQRPITF